MHFYKYIKSFQSYFLGNINSSLALVIGLSLELWHSGQVEDLFSVHNPESETGKFPKSGVNLWSVLQDLLMSLPNNPNFRSAAKRLVILATLIVR